jgi:disulfide bond formation protein DsbB
MRGEDTIGGATILLRMDVALADRFFALMALAALAGALGIAVLGIGGGFSPALARWNSRLRDVFGDWTYWTVFLVALVSMLGSLYYSEVVGYPPCSLCWYQRIVMYPLVVIMGIAAFKRDGKIRTYVLPLMVIGAILALYQYIIGYIPDAEILGCSLDVSCTERYIWEFGFVDFPLMSFIGFSFMISLMLWASPGQPTGSEE